MFIKKIVPIVSLVGLCIGVLAVSFSMITDVASAATLGTYSQSSYSSGGSTGGYSGGSSYSQSSYYSGGSGSPTYYQSSYYTPIRPTCTLTASPKSIASGKTSTLTWSTTGAAKVVLTRPTGTSSRALNGSVIVQPKKSFAYTITATGKGGTALCTALVSIVIPEPAEPTYSQSSYSSGGSTGGYSGGSSYSQSSYYSGGSSPSTYAQPSSYNQGTYTAPTTVVTGEAVRYLKTGEMLTLTNITKASALARCSKYEVAHPGTVLKCTWNGQVIYTPTTSAVTVGAVLGVSTTSAFPDLEQALQTLEGLLNSIK